jgi:DNA-directed RNA polymerase subunit beta
VPKASNVRPRQFLGENPYTVEPPHLLDIQLKSFEWFEKQGIREILDEISPIKDYTEKFEIYFREHILEEPELTPTECKEKDRTYQRVLKVRVELINRETGESKYPHEYFTVAEIPWMTDKGSFIVNGTERVMVSELSRSPGVYFFNKYRAQSLGIDERHYLASFWHQNGPLLEIVYYRERKKELRCLLRLGGSSKKPSLITFLLAMGLFGTGEPDKKGFSSALDKRISIPTVDQTDEERIYKLRKEAYRLIKEFKLLNGDFILEEKDPKNLYALYINALKEIYQILKPGEAWSETRVDDAKEIFELSYFSGRKYNLQRVGRYKINNRLNLDIPLNVTHLVPEDILAAVRYLLELSRLDYEDVDLDKFEYYFDDEDDLSIKRVVTVGELVKNQLRIGIARLAKYIRDKYVIDFDNPRLGQLINKNIVQGTLKELFGNNPRFQLMDQTNTLSALTHRRRLLSSLRISGGPKEAANPESRDVHPSHYGRICPIETPEGQNAGLITSLSVYAKVDDYGFLLAPYRKVENGRVTDEIVFLRSEDEIDKYIAPADVEIDENGYIKGDMVVCRYRRSLKGREWEDIQKRRMDYITIAPVERIDYIDLHPSQILSVSASLIPFVEHDDATRALMGANMQRQAVPLIRPQTPRVGTGLEHKVVVDSRDAVVYDEQEDGIVVYVSSEKIVVRTKKSGKEKVYNLVKYERTNQGTCYNQRPYVRVGDEVRQGDILADGPTSDGGELALGRDLLIAIMPWHGYNYEDAIVISERLVKEDLLSSVHIEEYEIEVRDTKLGPEEITREIPGVSEEALRNLDENGIVRIGAIVGPNDILVGKTTPKGESEATPEERLLKALFAEKSKDRKDSSLRVPHGEGGKVIDIRIFDREKGDELNPGVLKLVKVFVAQWRKIKVGDKLAGRHGNKGVISIVVPEEDMPFMEDGRPIDIIFNPLGIPSRMNAGQMELLLGHLLAVSRNGIEKVAEPPFTHLKKETALSDYVVENLIQKMLRQEGFETSGKVRLYDGRTGEPFDKKVTVGYMHILKLVHMVDDKIHARSVGPYSLITRQPLGGRAQFGGQRFGEMEVWALEAYGAAHTLQEILTIKSDDINGRIKAYESIVKGENIPESRMPEAFKVLVKELQSLGINVKAYDQSGKEVPLEEEEEYSFRRPDQYEGEFEERIIPEELHSFTIQSSKGEE